MTCAETLTTQAFLDGELTGEAADAAERHIAACADCQGFCDAAATLSDALRAAPRQVAPPRLRARLERALDAEDRRMSPAASSGLWGALIGAGATALLAAALIVVVLPPTASGLAAEVTDAHTRALMHGKAIAVVSTDHHTVKPWFAGRIALSPPVTDFAPQGFKLIGGRLDRIAGQPAAVVVYQHGKHQLDLYVWADQGSALPPATVRHGYRAVFWKRGDLDFAAVSDTAAPELASFVNLVRAAPE